MCYIGLERRVVRTLARLFGLGEAKLASLLQGLWYHDWEHDPWSRGAYSYPTVGGSGATDALGRPVRGTLFFAGEATESGGGTGTVDGAIRTGRRAAKQVLGALRA